MKNRVVTFEDFINEASLTGNMEIKEFVNESTDSDIKDFETKLAKHDWYYEMSDDPRSYKAGKAEEADIIAHSDGIIYNTRLKPIKQQSYSLTINHNLSSEQKHLLDYWLLRS